MSSTYILGDCLEKMKELPDKSVDCFICDLPYGCLSATGKEKATKERYINGKPTGTHLEVVQYSACDWDVKLNLEEFWKQVKRLCKDDHTPVLMFCNTKFGYDLIKSNEKWFRYDLVWDKENGVSFLSANKMPMKSHEMIYVFSKKGAYYKRIDIKNDGGKLHERGSHRAGKVYNQPKYEGNKHFTTDRCPLSVIKMKKKGGNHPTEKPEELYEWLLSRYCPDKGTVLDPTAGSFNSIVVAKRLGLKGIGIEKDRGFFYKAVSGLKEKN